MVKKIVAFESDLPTQGWIFPCVGCNIRTSNTVSSGKTEVYVCKTCEKCAKVKHLDDDQAVVKLMLMTRGRYHKIQTNKIVE